MGLFSNPRTSSRNADEPNKKVILNRLSRISELASTGEHDYALLEHKAKEDCYLDRIIVIKTLCGDQDPRSVKILEWVMRNGKDRSKNGVVQDERALAADALGKTGGEHALIALKRAIGSVDIQVEVRLAISEILRRGTGVLAE